MLDLSEHSALNSTLVKYPRQGWIGKGFGSEATHWALNRTWRSQTV